MKRFALFSLLILGCSISSPAPLPPPDPKRDLVIEGASIKYNGQSLPIGGSEKEWLRVLGPPSRDFEPGDHFYVWDDLGLYVRNHFKFKENIVEFGIIFSEQPPSKYYVYWPKHTFNGRLVIDGGLVSKDIPMGRVRKRPPEFREGPSPITYFYRRSDTNPRLYVSARVHPDGTPFYLALADATTYTAEQLNKWFPPLLDGATNIDGGKLGTQ